MTDLTLDLIDYAFIIVMSGLFFGLLIYSVHLIREDLRERKTFEDWK